MRADPGRPPPGRCRPPAGLLARDRLQVAAAFRERGPGGPWRPPEPAASLPAPHRRRPSRRGSSRPAGPIAGAPIGSEPSWGWLPRRSGGCSAPSHATPWRARCPHRRSRFVAGRSAGSATSAQRPGELIHIDVKKLGRIPEGGGWRAHGRGARTGHPASRLGFDYIHSAIDDHSRLAYSEIHPDERGAPVRASWSRAAGVLRRARHRGASSG